MIHFVVVTGTPAAVERESPRLRDALEATRLQDGERIEHTGASRTWAVAAISVPDRVCGARLAVDGDSMVVANGPMLATGGDQTTLIADLLAHFRASGSEGISAALGGSYNFVGVSPSVGVRALVDFSGLSPLYWHEGADFAMFSNRSTTIGHLLGNTHDVRALAWVIGHANLFGEHVPAAGVSYLAPGREARVPWGESRVDVTDSSGWTWPPPSDDRGRDNLQPAEWDEITEALVASFRAMRDLSAPVRLWLTGGKDSRLCLALAKAAGLQDRIETFTGGTVDSPEVECAGVVAAAAGFAHHRVGAPARPLGAGSAPAPAPPFDAERVWRRVRQDVYRYEGIVSAWSGLQNPTAAQLNIKGFGGELYRRGNAKQFGDNHPESVDALAAMFVNYHQVHDPLGVLRPSEAEFQSEWLKQWVHSTAEHVRLDLLPEKFYVDFRLGHWSGPLLQDAPVCINLNPLLLALAARKNTELSSAARGSERFHFEVMRRAAPELVGVPFLNDVWVPAIADTSPIELARAPFPSTVKPTGQVLTRGNPGWRLMEHEARAIAAVFKDAARKTDMGAICDMRKLRRIGRDAAVLKKSAPVKELHSSLGVALALLDRAEPVLDPPG